MLNEANVFCNNDQPEMLEGGSGAHIVAAGAFE